MSKQPTTWEDALERVGLVDPRNGRPSYNQLAMKAGLATSTITKIVGGKSKPSAATITKIAETLRIDPRLVSSWVGQKRTERVPYAPPAEADLLTDRQRRAVDEMIRAIIAEREDSHEAEAEDDAAAPTDLPQVDRRTVADGPTSRADLSLAAYEGTTRLDDLDAAAARAGEESQDPEDYR